MELFKILFITFIRYKQIGFVEYQTQVTCRDRLREIYELLVFQQTIQEKCEALCALG